MSEYKKINLAALLLLGYGVLSIILGTIISFTVAIPIDTDGDLIGETDLSELKTGLVMFFFSTLLALFLYKKKKFAYWLTLVVSVIACFLVAGAFSTYYNFISEGIALSIRFNYFNPVIVVLLAQLIFTPAIGLSLIALLIPKSVRALF